MKISARVAIAAASILALSACSAQQPSSEQRETVTLTTYVEPEASSVPTPAGEAQTEAAPVSTAAPQTQAASQVGGYCGTVGDGIEIQAYSATSCEFAREIYNAAISATYTFRRLNPTAPGADGASGLQVASPVTGKTYTIDCFKGSAGDALICGVPGDKTVGANFTSPDGAYWYSDRSPV